MAKRYSRLQPHALRPDELYDDFSSIPPAPLLPSPARLIKYKFRSVLPDVAEISDQDVISTTSVTPNSHKALHISHSKSVSPLEDPPSHVTSSEDQSEPHFSSLSVSETDDNYGDDETDSLEKCNSDSCVDKLPSSSPEQLPQKAIQKHAEYSSYLRKFHILKRTLEQLNAVIHNPSVKSLHRRLGGQQRVSPGITYSKSDDRSLRLSGASPLDESVSSSRSEAGVKKSLARRHLKDSITNAYLNKNNRRSLSEVRPSQPLDCPLAFCEKKTSRSLPNLNQPDATSTNETAHVLQQRLNVLSCELDTLRNKLHANGQPSASNGSGTQHHVSSQQSNINGGNGVNGGNVGVIPSHIGPPVPYLNLRQCPLRPASGQNQSSPHPPPLNLSTNPVIAGESYTYKPLPPHPPVLNNNPGRNSKYITPGPPLIPTNNNNNNNNNEDNNHLSSNNINNSVIQNNHHNAVSHQNANSSHYVNQTFPKDVMRANAPSGPDLQGPTSSSDDKVSGSLIGTATATTNSASSNEGTPSEASFKLMSSSVLSATSAAGTALSKVHLAEIEDLIHLHGPLTEDALMRCLQARCSASKYYIHMGPILLIANPFNALGNPLTLSSTKVHFSPPPVQKIVQEALRQQGDTGYPQAIILSGCSGSGKTYTSMLVLRQLFEVAGGGVETDAFKHLVASITVLRSLGTARTVSNTESSRIGHFIEVQVTEGTVYRTKVHCYFLDQNRIVSTSEGEKNYHIFYQMLAGLNAEERAKLHLGKHTERTLNYLRSSCPPVERESEASEDAMRFLDWKTSLRVLGIPFFDVVRVLAAVILIGNVRFVESPCMEMEVEGVSELQAAASLLGVSETALKQGLTTRTHNVRNQSVRSRCDANLSNFSRDSLAKSLYCRTVATIVRRTNSLKRLSSTSGTLSSDSTDSVHNQAETLSQHASTVGTAGSKASKSMTALNNAVRHATDGFIGILDMFGFEDVKPSNLEHLCINLCAETMQHFYNTHIFKACIESCRDEGIQCDWEVDYVDNVPCIDLISSLRTGLLSMLDVECSLRGTVESYVQKVRTQHKQNPRLLETNSASDLRSFAIQHYAGNVQYDATAFMETNRDVLADDLVAVFHKHRCSFGFASHLFSSELKILGAGGMEPCPRGISFRISPTSHTELLNGEEPVSTLTQDFHTRLDNLLRTLVHARPHFIRCIKLNSHEQPGVFDRHAVSKQLRAFQVLETINLMANGYPHRMRFKAFNARYKLLAPLHQLSRTDDRVTDDCQRILECFVQALDENSRERMGHISISWALGKRHIFMSEGARQQLENMRVSTRNNAATLIQCTWRGWHHRQRWPLIRQGFHLRFQSPTDPRHPQHISINPSHPNRINPSINPHQLPGDPATSGGLNGGVNNIIYRNGIMVSGIGGSSMVNLHNLQTQSSAQGLQQSQGMNGILPPISGPSSPPAIPIPVPRSTINAGGSGNGIGSSRNGMTANPAVATLNTTSIATISIVNGSSSSGVHTNGSTASVTTGGSRPRPQPISGTPPPDVMDRCDPKLVQQTCNLFGLDMERPPPLPPSRSYTVAGNTKLGYPQTRTMKMTFPEEGVNSDIRLLKGDAVVVVGSSTRRGHLLVEHNNRNVHVPFQFLELKAPS